MGFPSTATFPATAHYPSSASFPASATFPATPVPFDPSQLTGLILGLQYDAAHCTSNTPGQPVSSVSAAFGTARTASQALLLRPTFQTGGLSYGDTQYMNLNSQIVLSGTAFTYYGVANWNGADMFPLGSVLGFDYTQLSGGALSFNPTGASGAISTSATGIVAYRISSDASGNFGINITGGGGGASGGPYTSWTIDALGASVANFGFSADTANLLLLDVLKTGDNTGTQEDTNMLAWLLSTYGVTVP